MDRMAFIARIAPDAVRDWQQNRIAASLTIAQAALESNFGTSGLTVKANNLFGIKGTGPAGSEQMQTTEYRGGSPVRVTASFRKYHSWAESIADHSRLLLTKRYQAVPGKTGKEAARAVAAAGYATDPGYAAKLIAMMDKYELYKYDLQGGDEPMTAEEKKLFQALQATVSKQAEQIAALQRYHELPTPEWAKESIQAALDYDRKNPLIQNPEQGSLDFYRIITVLHRRGLFKKSG